MNSHTSPLKKCRIIDKTGKMSPLVPDLKDSANLKVKPTQAKKQNLGLT